MAKSLATNVREFNQAVTRFEKTLVPEQVALLHKKIALEALRRVVLKTPVDTGRARGNWQTTIDSPAEGEVRGRWKKTGRRSKQVGQSTEVMKGAQIIATARPFSTIFLTNNVPYIVRLENGWSKQAPKGMVSTTVEELRAMFP